MNSIYLIGENLLTIELLKYKLEREGYQIGHGTVQESIHENKATDFAPDIIFWDNDTVVSNYDCIVTFRKHSDSDCKSILVLSSSNLPVLGKGIALGIEGFTHKKGGVKELIKCIGALKKGRCFISPFLAGESGSKSGTVPRKNMKCDLTPQELKILRLVHEGFTSREIAPKLNVSIKTVQNHRFNMCRKLGLRGQNSLAEFAKLYFEEE